ncbi:MAG: hypothetical protein II248_01115 [Paludibacteraceae bacterium]|nr:hypothetical protein [Paludibacteraceae bacterium]
MIRIYCVAGHNFQVESSNEMLLAQMTNYEPFGVDQELDTKPIFVLEVEQNGLLHDEQCSAYQHVFTDNSEDDMPRIEVYRSSEKDWLIRVSQIATSPICCELICTSDFTHGALHIDGNCQDIRFCIDNGLMLMYAFRTAPLMTLEMHAAVVVKKVPEFLGSNGSKGEDALGYLFLGHSGTGKSTHARQWLAAFEDAWLLNDDNPILRVMDDGQVRVYGSPWSGKTPCYKNADAPVGAIVKLSQAPENKIHSITLPQAYAYMLSSASGLKMEQTMADNMFETIKHIITHTPCYHLACLPNEEAAKVCWAEIKGR